ncbi:guanylate kinase [Paenibacillaceae bacterium WGS1546]|uniref:guanylate kinase n=1 Tax=Cohnella sp. WGS1546 TaxID=3366810 RepID=UPI00372D3B17
MREIDHRGRSAIFVYTGPDGSGRKSVAEAVGQTFGMEKIVSFATRQPRSGEVDGQDYWFVSHEHYREMERRGEFLESVEIDGNLYGIRSQDIERKLQAHDWVYLILNREGASILKRIYGDRVIRLFLYADRRSLEERQRRLGMTDAVIARYLRHYDKEMDYRAECEHAFENFDLGQATYEITNTLEAYLQRNLIDKD